MPIVYIEGNIGAGKSTFIAQLKERYQNVEWVPEPINEWNDYKENTKTIIELYYENPQKYAAFFQNVVVQSKIKTLMHILKNPDKTYVIERSFYSDFWVFGRILADKSLVTALEYQYLHSWFSICESLCQDQVRGVIYLDADVELCKKRIIKRGREGEANIDMDYLQQIETAYKSWLLDTKVPVIHIPCCENMNSKMKNIEHMFE